MPKPFKNYLGHNFLGENYHNLNSPEVDAELEFREQGGLLEINTCDNERVNMIGQKKELNCDVSLMKV